MDQAGTGRIIQALRRERGLTQEALAGMLGVSAAAAAMERLRGGAKRG